MQNKNFTDTYKGQLIDFPTEVVEKMLYYQVEQGNERNVTVFEKDKASPLSMYGFNWGDTPENLNFWNDVITNKNFNQFFERYPKQTTESEFPEILQQLFDQKAQENNQIDLNAYANGLLDCYNLLNNKK